MRVNNPDELIAMLDSLCEKGVGEIKVKKALDETDQGSTSYNECRPGSACFTPTLMQGLDAKEED